MDRNNSLELASAAKKSIFSLHEDDYRAICFFDVSLLLGGNPSEYNFGLHVPVVQEKDQLYYALCWEIGQVTYGSGIKNSLERMALLLQDLMDAWLRGETDWKVLFSNPMDQRYLHIFHRIKNRWNIEKAGEVSNLVKGYDADIETVLEERLIYTVKSKIGTAEIRRRFALVA